MGYQTRQDEAGIGASRLAEALASTREDIRDRYLEAQSRAEDVLERARTVRAASEVHLRRARETRAAARATCRRTAGLLSLPDTDAADNPQAATAL
jgi:hypothetical protein